MEFVVSHQQQALRMYVGVVQVWGASGYVDFYLPEPLCTALELTRDSDRWQEHLQRFAPRFTCCREVLPND